MQKCLNKITASCIGGKWFPVFNFQFSILHFIFGFFILQFTSVRLVIQRVSHAEVAVGGEIVGRIGNGLMVLVGVREGDTEEDARWLAAKTMAMRIFDDDHGVMNRSVADIGGEVLAVSQFTLNASTKKGNRPSYIYAACHDVAIPLYELFCAECERICGNPTQKGIFGADMQCSLTNDGPVTIVIDSRLRE